MKALWTWTRHAMSMLSTSREFQRTGFMGKATGLYLQRVAVVRHQGSKLLPKRLDAGMAPRMDDVMRLCCEISAHDQITVAVKNSTKGALVAGGTAFVGGLLGGPPGIAVGGCVGGLLGSWLTSGQFRPLPQILMELPANQQKLLYDQVASVLGNMDWMDAAQLVALVLGNATLQQQVTAALLSFITKELRAEVKYQD